MATLNVVQNQQMADVTGEGYDPEAVLLRMTAPDGSLTELGIGVWGDGSLNPTSVAIAQSGEHVFETYQGKGKHTIYEGAKFLEQQASTTLEVT